MEKCSCVQSYTAGGSILCDPSKQVSDEPLLFQRRLRRQGSVPIQQRNRHLRLSSKVAVFFREPIWHMASFL